MTIRYMKEAASAKYSPFFRLIFRWKGSVHKAIFPETCAYGILFGLVYVVYHKAMTSGQQDIFEAFCEYSIQSFPLIPISFVLGFFVNLVATRWWQQFLAIPYPDSIALYTSVCMDTASENSRRIRKTIVRYINLAFVMSMRNISAEAMKLFKCNKDLVISGLITNRELAIINALDTDKNSMMLPISWAYELVIDSACAGKSDEYLRKKGKEKIITGPVMESNLLELISDYKDRISRLNSFIWINPPLMYTQIATLTVYLYCLLKVFSQQIVADDTEFTSLHTIFIHALGYLQFVFYMGWLKVAESLTNPFGDDAEDFDIKPIIDRNIKVCNVMVDDLCLAYPPITADLLQSNTSNLDSDEPINGANGEVFVLDTDNSKRNSEVGDMFVGTLVDVELDPLEGDEPPIDCSLLAVNNSDDLDSLHFRRDSIVSK